MPKIPIAGFVSLLIPFSQIKYNEIPMRMYNVIQTGEKAQFGGVNHGFASVGYQSIIAVVVNIEPKIPADKHIAMEIKNFFMFNFSTIYLFIDIL